MPYNATAMAGRIKRLAADEGFERCGIAEAAPISHADFFRDWLAQGRAGTMGYLHRHQASRIDVRAWLPWARSVIVVALNYRQPPPSMPKDAPRGRVAMYAWGGDYHEIMRAKLTTLVEKMRGAFEDESDSAGASFQYQICVDTSAIIERELAAAAGIGWIGKNTMILHEGLGSYFFLGEIITDLALPADGPALDHCGTCTRCLDACPTKAFPAPYQMDASRCISYLTIEHRSAIDDALAARMGDWIYGCDVCQDVCPHNRRAPGTTEPGFKLDASSPQAAGDAAFPRLEQVAQWDESDYRRAVTGKASDRARLDMWKRNANIAARNLSMQCTPPSASAEAAADGSARPSEPHSPQAPISASDIG